MTFNYNKLRGRIIEKFGTIEQFACTLGCTFEIVSKKLNNKSSFSQKNINDWINLLEIPVEEIGVYFFTIEVQS